MRKKFEDLSLKDNFMFCAVMSEPEICKVFLERLLEIEIEEIQVDYEKSIIYHPEYKSIRLDILAKDEAKRHYNVEMQTEPSDDIAKRSRYYHSQMDMEMLESGLSYRELPAAYVIFLCDYDPFQEKLYRYTFRNKCEETDRVLGDERISIFLSTAGENAEEEWLVRFLDYVKSGQTDGERAEDELIHKIQHRIQYVKQDRKMGRNFMLLQELIDQERAKALQEGIEKGIEKGEKRSLQNSIMDFLSDLGLIPPEIEACVRNETNLDTLRQYVKLAARSQSIEEFKNVVKSLK